MSDPVQQTTDAAREVFGARLRCLLVTGAAVRGGGVPGLTPLEMRLLLDATTDPMISHEDVLAFRDRIGDLWPFGGLETVFAAHDRALGSARIPAPGGYRVLIGEPPECFHDVTADQLRDDAHRNLDALEPTISELLTAAMDPDTATVVRRLYRVVLSCAYDTAVVLTGTPFRVWTTDAVALEPVIESAGLTGLTGFLDRLREWPDGHRDPAWLRARLGEGLAAVAELADWWVGARDRLTLADA